MADRAHALVPGSLIVLERGSDDQPALVVCSPDAALRSLVASTYMAGELRRYWGFAATLSAGTGLGAAHPPITEVAATLTQSLPCFSLILGKRAGGYVSPPLQAPEVAA